MFDIVTIVTNAGYLGIILIVFAECGLFFGFFLPGDSLLFTAGFLASQGHMNIVELILFTVIAAILGESVGYIFGRRVGPMLFTWTKSRFFDPAHVHRAHAFFVQHGNKAVFFARFLPIVRTFVPIVAGIAKMPSKQFTLYNIIGGIVWVSSMTLLGYGLGSHVKNADHYLYPIIITIILVSFLPALFEWHKAKRVSRKHTK